MSIPLSQELTMQFYAWEMRGRGWLKAPYSVDLEPPYEPFFFRRLQPQYVDDGKRPTILSKLADFVKGKPKSSQVAIQEEYEDDDLIPFPFLDERELKLFRISLPKGYKVRVDETEQLLKMLSHSSSPISFEIIGTHTSITIQIVCSDADAVHVAGQLKAYFPLAVIEDKTEMIGDIIREGLQTFTVDFGLKEEFMRPISIPCSFDIDPLIGLFGVLEHLQDGEQGVVQILCKGVVNQWDRSILRSVMDAQGGSFFADAPEMVTLTKEKVSSPLFAAAIRCLGQSPTIERAHIITEQIAHTLIRMSHSQSNSLIPLMGEEYSFEERIDDIWFRESSRLGMLLNVQELSLFLHLPSASVVSSKLIRDTRKTKALPAIAEHNSFVVGSNIHQGVVKEVTLSSSQRLKHTHIIGATGTGKSTFLLNLIVEDITQGNGIAVLDPHGDLIEYILPYIPENRVSDVVIIDPADADYPVGFNILTAHSEIEKEILSSDLVSAFRRLSTSWGDQMNSVFGNAILAFLESTEGGTLADLRRFLVEKSFRDKFLTTVTDPSIVYYWQKEYPLLKSNSIGSILTRLDTFLRPKSIRNMVAQEKSLDFETLLDSKKIILIKLSQGLIGTENSYLLGTFVVSKIHQAAMARQAKAKEDRSDFFVYIDEFQNFITPSMSSILSGARKYHVGLILAHQDMQQLTKYDMELASSVLANAGTRICFRIGDADAKKFAEGFTSFEQQDLQNLSTGEAIVRIERPEYDFSLTCTPLPESTVPPQVRQKIIDHSREVFSTPRLKVEEELAKRLQVDIPQPRELQKEKVITQPIKEPIKSNEESLSVSEAATQTQVLNPIDATETKKTLVQKKIESQHRYLQTLIKKMAEARGYKATIEKELPNNAGRVDVALEKDMQSIAVEVSVTTETEWEIHNIRKCLTVGFTTIISCSPEKKTLEAIKEASEIAFIQQEYQKLLFLEPDELFLFLDQVQAKEATTETRFKGYRVKVEYDAVSGKEMQQKRDAVARVVLDSMKKVSRK